MPKSKHQDNQPEHIPNAPDKPQGSSTAIKAEYHYASSLPHPSIVEGYKHIDPSFPERIMKQFEENAEHFRRQDAKALDGDITEKKRGQWMAFAIILTGMVATIITACLEFNSATIVTALGTVAVIFKGVFTK